MSKNILLLAASLSEITVSPPIKAIQVGCALSEHRFPNMLYDDIGINISEKNPYYCELTAQYWAWKNTQSDFIGFLHHRRYFSFEENKICDLTHKRKVRPYSIFHVPNDETLCRIHFSAANLERMTEQYDIIAPTAENIHETIIQQYNRCEKPKTDEMTTIQKLIMEHYPQYCQAAQDYLNGKNAYFCNMFIMRRDLFEDYCTWLFELLERMDGLRSENERCLRDDGKIAERLFGIYFTFIKQTNRFRWAEVPRVHFSDLDGASKNQSFNRFWYFIAPPGSVRRAILRRL